MRRTVKTGIIGCGLMGREFASAAARWVHLEEDIPSPEIVGVCSRTLSSTAWFTRNIPTVRTAVTDYRELLADPEIELIYCAVPHNLHEGIYTDIIAAGKHLLGEKPFGMDRAQNDAILASQGLKTEHYASVLKFTGGQLDTIWAYHKERGLIKLG